MTTECNSGFIVPKGTFAISRLAARSCRIVLAVALLFAGVPPSLSRLAAQQHLLTLTPTTRIDATAADLTSITFVVVTPGGEMVLGQRQDNRVLVFFPAGELLTTLGRAGEGPGEYRYVMRGGWHQDFLWVFDNALHRVNLFDRRYKLARTLPVPTSVSLSPGSGLKAIPLSGLTVAGMTPAGGFLVRGIGQSVTGSFVSVFASVPPNGTTGAVLWSYQRPESESCVVTASGRRFDLPTEECFASSNAVAPDGLRIAIVSAPPSQPVIDAFRLTVLGVTGDTLLDRIIPVRPFPIDTKRYQASIDTLFAHLPGNSPLLEHALRSQMETPTNYPAASAILCGNDGSIWIRRRNKTGQIWQGLDSQGKYFGEIALPLTSKLVSASASGVYVIHRDADGLESLVKYVTHS